MSGFLEEVPGLEGEAASPEAVTEPTETTLDESTDDGQQAQETAAPGVKTYEFDFGEGPVRATADEIREWRTSATNMSSMAATSTQRYQEAAEMRKQAEAILNDEKLKELRTIQEMIEKHPETLQEYQEYKAYLQGNHRPVPQPYGRPAISPINTQLAYQNTLLQRQAYEREEQERQQKAMGEVEKFRANHSDISDEQFGSFYESFKAEVAPDSLAATDLEYFHYQRYGAMEAQVKVAEAREEGMSEAERKILEGRSVGGVTPAGHITHDWTPSPDNKLSGMEASRRAAMDDKTIQFDGSFPG